MKAIVKDIKNGACVDFGGHCDNFVMDQYAGQTITVKKKRGCKGWWQGWGADENKETDPPYNYYESWLEFIPE